MKLATFDTETYLIRKKGKAVTNVVPRAVCVQYTEDDGEPQVVDRAEGARWLLEVIRNTDAVLLGHNLVYDLRVAVRLVDEELGEDIVPDIFKALAAGRGADTAIREQLHSIANGGIYYNGEVTNYSLAGLVKHHLDVDMAGKHGADVWRLRYAELDGVPLSKWPRRAWEYARLDPYYTREVWRAQEARGRLDVNASGVRFQVSADWWLGLASAWGLKVDLDRAAEIDAHYAALEDKWARWLKAHGIMDASGTVSSDAKRAIVEEAFEELGEDPIRTPTGMVAANSRAFDYLEDRDVTRPAFQALRQYTRANKFRATYLEPLLDAEGEPVCPRYRVLVDTGRTSASGPNVQNFPARPTSEELARLEEDPDAIVGADIRTCIVPRDGWTIITADYSALEMATLAQVNSTLEGHPVAMAQAINAGQDLHLRVAAVLAGVDYDTIAERYADGDPEAKRLRTISKIANFGFAGGASAETFLEYARNFGVVVDALTAQQARDAWFRAWPEMQRYFADVSRAEQFDGSYRIEHHGPDGMALGWRHRQTGRFTSAANSRFQGLAADGAKFAGFLISRECYCEPDSPLFGARIILFVHDEFGLEVPPGADLEAAAERLSHLMVQGMSRFTPDVTIAAEPEILEGPWRK